jgi:hypothetical protein
MHAFMRPASEMGADTTTLPGYLQYVNVRSRHVPRLIYLRPAVPQSHISLGVLASLRAFGTRSTMD